MNSKNGKMDGEFAQKEYFHPLLKGVHPK